MEPPPASKWPGYIVAIFIVLSVGGAFAAAKMDAIFALLGQMVPMIGPALEGAPGAIFTVMIIGVVVVYVFILIPGRLGLFKMLRP